MAVPTISSLTPSEGLTGGETFVIINGTNFDTEVGVMEVLFDTKKAIDVFVRSSTVMAVRTPRHVVGLSDVTVRNTDTSEESTVTDAYQFKRPDLTNQESEIQRVAEQIIRIMRIEIIENVFAQLNSSHTDYVSEDSALFEKEYQSKLPSIVLEGPEIQENRFYSVNFGRTLPDFPDTDVYSTFREPYTVDVIFTLKGTGRVRQEASVLFSETIKFFKRNEFIGISRPSNSPNPNELEIYEFDIVRPGFTFMPPQSDNENVFQFEGDIIVRGVNICEDEPFIQNKPVSEITPTIPGLPFDANVDLEVEKID